jgi:hypothetical protein
MTIVQVGNLLYWLVASYPCGSLSLAQGKFSTILFTIIEYQ